MSVVSTNEIWVGSGMNESVVDGKITFTRKFRVVLSAPAADGINQARVALRTLIPPGTEFATGTNSYAARYNAGYPFENDRRILICDVTYETPAFVGSQNPPWLQPMLWRREGVPVSITTHTYVDGTTHATKTYRNAATDLFDPPPTRTEFNTRWTLTKSCLSYNLNWNSVADGSVNDTGFTIPGANVTVTAYKAILRAFNVSNSYYGIIQYYNLTWDIEVCGRGWKSNLLQAGYNVMKKGKLVRAKEDTANDGTLKGDARATPVFLDKTNGARLADNADAQYTEFNDIVIATYPSFPD